MPMTPGFATLTPGEDLMRVEALSNCSRLTYN
jgi:hypothetical protein